MSFDGDQPAAGRRGQWRAKVFGRWPGKQPQEDNSRVSFLRSLAKYVVRDIVWLGAVGVCATTLGLASVFLYLNPQIPTTETYRHYRFETPLRIFTADGALVAEFGNRLIPIDFDDVPRDFINALLLPGDDIEGTVARSAEVGVTSFKTMVAYASRGQMLDDASICLLMERAAAVGGVTLVHAENGGAIDYLDAVERRRGVTNASYLRSQPVELEPEGMNRTAMFAALTGCHLHFVHCTSAPGAAMVGALKDSGGSVTAETQIHYLLLTNDEVLQRGPLGKVGPPLRDADHLPRLWEALADGRIDHLSSDHSPKSLEVKLATANILDATFGGIAGTGVMLPLAFSEGFKKGRLTIERVAEVTSTRAAQIYGIYPQKGVLAEGSDADLVVIAEDQPEVPLTHDNLAPEAGFSLYESIVTSGMPNLVVRGGSVVLSDAELTGPENGRYLARSGQA